MFLDAITENKVATEISQLDGNTSGGYDEISPKVVKAVSKHIVKPLMHIYNQSFVTGIVPSELKKAVVTPMFKSNDKESFSHYRPISVLPCFSKILEKLMYKRVVKFLDKGVFIIHGEGVWQMGKRNVWNFLDPFPPARTCKRF